MHSKRCMEWDAYIMMNLMRYTELDVYNKWMKADALNALHQMSCNGLYAHNKKDRNRYKNLMRNKYSKLEIHTIGYKERYA